LAGRTGQVIVASRADEYRLRAQRCLEMAAAFSDRDSRLTLSHMAQAWLGVADRYQGGGKTQPAFQQQQQAQPKQAQRGSAGLAKDESPMPSHKFHIGETVTLIPSISRNVAGGMYQVVSSTSNITSKVQTNSTSALRGKVN